MTSNQFEIIRQLNSNLKLLNPRMAKVIQRYSFIVLDEKFHLSQEIFQNIKESKAIIIDHYKYEKNVYFIIGFQKTIIIVSQYNLQFLNSLFTTNQQIQFCFLQHTKDLFNKNITITYQEIENNSFYADEILNLNKIMTSTNNEHINQNWNLFKSCISGYLIKSSYFKSFKDRLKNFTSKKESLQKFFSSENFYKKDEYVILRTLGKGSEFKVDLIYLIEKEELFALKNPCCIDSEIPKLTSREYENYSNLYLHSFFPQFYGIVKHNNFLVIEFINGNLLTNIENIELTADEIILIIFELMISIEFIQRYNFILRDLKPDNIMIDENKNAVLIDFDRMIKFDNASNDQFTNYFTIYSAPEVNKGQFDLKSDIYSLGLVINYILTKKERIMNECDEIKNIVEKCVKEKKDERPSILNLLIEFFKLYYTRIKNHEEIFNKLFGEINFNKNIKDGQIYYDIGCIYFFGKYVKQDIDKAIQYLTYAAEINCMDAQAMLGEYYRDNKYEQFNIDKAIHYWKLASDQNSAVSQFNLGMVYINGEHVRKNVILGIEYLELSAKQNIINAQVNLGRIYLQDKLIPRNITKSIHYLTLAAKQGDVECQTTLGYLYSSNIWLEPNINKAIYFLSLAVEKNDPEAQYLLGSIYLNNKSEEYDIKKAINYYTLAADQGYCLAQFELGLIYSEYKIIAHDIKKAIHYYTLAAEQNFEKAQYNLGMIYLHYNYEIRDINKAIKYFLMYAEQGYSYGYYVLGTIYYEGLYIKRDIKKAIYYLELASNQNNYEADYLLGMIYIDEHCFSYDVNKAIHFLTLAADGGNSEAQFQIGLIYFEGLKTKVNIEKAIYYFKLAGNIPEALFNLGLIYYDGIYVPRDVSKAIHYFQLSSDLNFVKAFVQLGLIYEDGKYVEPDLNKAIYYYSHASDQNDANSNFCLGLIYSNKESKYYDINKAIRHYILASNNGCAEAANNLAIIYIFGIEVPQDIIKAIHYFKLSANLNYSKAQYNLGFLYYEGLVVERNIDKGIYLLIQSKNNRVIKAFYLLGFIYHEGRNVKRDILKSIRFYKEASSFNNQYAKTNLGVIYKKGFGSEVKENRSLAIEYFEEAIRKKKDILSMFNLANLYFYDKYRSEEKLKEVIKLLVSSTIKGFKASNIFLCLVLIFIRGLDINENEIREEINVFIKDNEGIPTMLFKTIKEKKLNVSTNFNNSIVLFKNLEFIYNDIGEIIIHSSMINRNKSVKSIYNDSLSDISSLFYEGFGIYF